MGRPRYGSMWTVETAPLSVGNRPRNWPCHDPGNCPAIGMSALPRIRPMDALEQTPEWPYGRPPTDPAMWVCQTPYRPRYVHVTDPTNGRLCLPWMPQNRPRYGHVPTPCNRSMTMPLQTPLCRYGPTPQWPYGRGTDPLSIAMCQPHKQPRYRCMPLPYGVRLSVYATPVDAPSIDMSSGQKLGVYPGMPTPETTPLSPCRDRGNGVAIGVWQGQERPTIGCMTPP